MSKAANLASVGARQWRIIQDVKVTTPVANFTLPLPAQYEQFRLTLDISPVAGAGTNTVNLYPSYRLSQDGGATYPAVSGNYYYSGYINNSGTESIITMTPATIGPMGQRVNNLYPWVGSHVEFTFRNQAGRAFFGKTNFSTLDETNWIEGEYLQYSPLGKSTHMQIYAGDIGGSPYGSGTRLILEAY